MPFPGHQTDVSCNLGHIGGLSGVCPLETRAVVVVLDLTLFSEAQRRTLPTNDLPMV